MNRGRVIVTGAGGFTGRHACRQLAAAGWEVTAVASPRSAPDFWHDLGASDGDRCDLTNGKAVYQRVERIQPAAILHLAGQNAVNISWREPADTLMINAMSTVYLLEAIREVCPECRLVTIGSMLRLPPERMGDAQHPYAFSKMLQYAAASAWHRWYGLPIIFAEPCNLIGPGGSAGICGKIARWAVRAETGAADVPPFRLSSLTEERDYLDVRDAVSAYELLLRAGVPGKTYALTSGTFRTLAEVRQAFDEEARAPLNWQVEHASGAISPIQTNSIPSSMDPLRTLGWQPHISFRQSVMDTLEGERRRTF